MSRGTGKSKGSFTAKPHLRPEWIELLVTGRRLGLPPLDTRPSAPLWSCSTRKSHSGRPDSAPCCKSNGNINQCSVEAIVIVCKWRSSKWEGSAGSARKGLTLQKRNVFRKSGFQKILHHETVSPCPNSILI